MALSSEFVSSGVPGNPWKQPCFAIWSNNGSYGGVNFVDHNMQTLSREQYDNGSYGAQAMRSNGAPEMFDNWAGSSYTLSQAPAQSNSEYTCSQYQGYLGHIVFAANHYDKGNCGIEMMGSTGYNSYRSIALRNNCVIVNDIDQDYAIWVSDTQLKTGPRSLDWYAYHWHSNSGQYITVSTKNAGYANTRYGTGSYNAKTNKLCIMESNGSYAMKPVIYSNVPSLRWYSKNMYRGDAESFSAQTAGQNGALYTHFNTAANYTTSYGFATGKPRNANIEDNYRCVTVMCDNDRVVMMQMIPNGNPGAWITRWSAAGTSEGSLRNWSGTTSYGLDQGSRYGIRYCVSSDGQFVLAWCPYYYYGSGPHTALIRVSDGKIVWDQTNDTTYSYWFFPRGKSDFVCTSNVNADGGSGMYYQIINTHQLMDGTADAQQVNMTRSFITQLLSSNYNSTDYPYCIPLQYDTRAFNTDY